MDINVGDVLKLKKQHPCGSREWEVLRVGADFRLKCLGCGHQIMIARKLLEKNVKEIVEKAGLLTAPLRDRFGMIHHLEFYTIEELQQIIMHSARILDVEIEPAGAKEMARRSRGTPRLANRILKRVRDFAQVKYDGIITEEVARTALDLMDVDKMGLDHIDRNILVTIIEKFDGGPVGLDTLAAAIGEDAGTIEDVYEPYLIKNGFLNRTPKGRVVTDLTYHHLGLN